MNIITNKDASADKLRQTRERILRLAAAENIKNADLAILRGIAALLREVLPEVK